MVHTHNNYKLFFACSAIIFLSRECSCSSPRAASPPAAVRFPATAGAAASRAAASGPAAVFSAASRGASVMAEAASRPSSVSSSLASAPLLLSEGRPTPRQCHGIDENPEQCLITIDNDNDTEDNISPVSLTPSINTKLQIYSHIILVKI